MICPECGSEYREGFSRCQQCDVDLVVPRPPVEPGEPKVKLVKVYETGNAALVPLFESLLADAGIEFMTKNEPLQDLFGWGRFGSNVNFVIGPVEFYVREDVATEAREIAESFAIPAEHVPDEPE